jgi:hypothetical protein
LELWSTVDQPWMSGTELIGARPPTALELKDEKQGAGEGKWSTENAFRASLEDGWRQGGWVTVSGSGGDRMSFGGGMLRYERGGEGGMGERGEERHSRGYLL